MPALAEIAGLSAMTFPEQQFDDALRILLPGRVLCRVQVEEFMAMGGVGHGAGLKFPEDSIAATGYHPVNPVAQHFGQIAEQDTTDLPDAAKFLQYLSHSLTPAQEVFMREAASDEVHGVEQMGVNAAPSKQALREIALNGRKTKIIAAVPPDDKPDQPVAQRADAVVQDYRPHIAVHFEILTLTPAAADKHPGLARRARYGKIPSP